MIEFMQKQKALCVSALSLIGTAALTTVLPREMGWAHELIYCVLFTAASFYFIWRAMRVLRMRLAVFSAAGGLLLALSLVVGADVYEDLHIALSIINLARAALITLCLSVPIAAGLACLLDAVVRYSDRTRFDRLEASKCNPDRYGAAKLFLIVWGVLLLLWLPAYLGYFPGIWGYDMHNQNHQALTGHYNAYQPLLHTLLYQLCYRIGTGVFGTGTAGVAVYTAVQALGLSACLAYTVTYIGKTLRAPFFATLLAVAFYGLMPINAILAVSSTKDALFTGLFLVLLTQTCELCIEPEAFFKSVKRMILFVLPVVLCCLLRNNMLYAFLFGGLLLVLGLKAKRLQVLLLVAACAVMAVLSNRALSAALSAGSGPRTELLNVPIQQVACVYNRHEQTMDDEDKQAIYAYLPETLLQNYYPLLSDPVKLDASIGDGLPSIIGFLKVWARFLPQYFNDYVDSFLTMTLGYWFPGERFHSLVYNGYDEPDTEETLGYLYTGFMEDINEDVHQRHLWPDAERYYQWFAHQNGHQRIPVLSLLFAPGTYCWILFFALLALVYYRRIRLALPLGMLYGVWLTLLLGPCVIVRYVYPITASAPLLMGMLLNNRTPVQLEKPVPLHRENEGDGRFAEVLRFVVAGGTGFVIDYGCTYVFTSFVGLHYLLATALAFTLSVVVNYLMCAYWVFRGVDTHSGGVKAGFLITSLIGLGLNELFMFVFVDALHLPVMLAKLVAVVLVMIWNYISKRKVLVKQPKNTGE